MTTLSDSLASKRLLQDNFLRFAPLFILPLLLSVFPAKSFGQQSTSSITFSKQSYSYTLLVNNQPSCSGILEVLYSMKTMKELTSFIDSIEMIRKEPSLQHVRIGFSLLGLKGKLLYERTINRDNNTMTIALKSFENNFNLMPYPTAFRADYAVSHADNQTSIKYTQRVKISKELSFFYRLFIKHQMRTFKKKLTQIIQRTCR